MHHLAQEIEVWHVIPAIRREFAEEMRKRGISQTEIAKKLHLTRAAVSQYISKKRASVVKFDVNVKKKIKEAAERLMGGGCPIKEIQTICTYFKSKGYLCKLHHKLDKSLKKCGVCSP